MVVSGGTLVLNKDDQTGTLTLNQGGAPAGAADQGGKSVAVQQAEKIIIPAFDCKEATLDDALDFLRKAAVEADPEKKGVKIDIKPGTITKEIGDIRITMALRDVPVIEALRYITGLANVAFATTPDALVVQPTEARPAGPQGEPPSIPFGRGSPASSNRTARSSRCARWKCRSCRRDSQPGPRHGQQYLLSDSRAARGDPGVGARFPARQGQGARSRGKRCQYSREGGGAQHDAHHHVFDQRSADRSLALRGRPGGVAAQDRAQRPGAGVAHFGAGHFRGGRLEKLNGALSQVSGMPGEPRAVPAPTDAKGSPSH